jgi:hypothetical protein
MEQFTQIFRAATAAIAPEYFLLPIHGAESVYRERVHCYELYHQMSRLWPADSLYRLNGEVDKRAHPYFEEWGEPKPDFLVHQPGTRENYAVMEVKASHAVSQGIDKDLKTLEFFRSGIGYIRAIYLIFGADALYVGERVREHAGDLARNGVFELWLQPTVGAEATY